LRSGSASPAKPRSSRNEVIPSDHSISADSADRWSLAGYCRILADVCTILRVGDDQRYKSLLSA
jgi:hypothetical protein